MLTQDGFNFKATDPVLSLMPTFLFASIFKIMGIRGILDLGKIRSEKRDRKEGEPVTSGAGDE